MSRVISPLFLFFVFCLSMATIASSRSVHNHRSIRLEREIHTSTTSQTKKEVKLTSTTPQSELLGKLEKITTTEKSSFLANLTTRKCPENDVLCNTRAEIEASNKKNNAKLHEIKTPFGESHHLSKWLGEAIANYAIIISITYLNK